MDWIGPFQIAAAIGGLGGIVFGLAARLGRFCTLGAIEDALYAETYGRLGMWFIAIGVAITGTFLASFLGYFDPGTSIYANAPFSPIASILGGLIFGYGMALSGNCGYGALARLGGGDLRSFVIVLVMGISAMITLSGPIAHARLQFIEMTAIEMGTPSIPALLEGLTGFGAASFGLLIGSAILAASLFMVELRANKKNIFWGGAIGLTVTITWVAMYRLNDLSFDVVGVVGHTFSAPIGRTILFLMTSSGGGLGFGVGSVMGVLAGAFVGSMFLGHFRWEACEDPRELRRQILGAALMGFGAALALGCSIGQGLTAMSTLTLSAPLVLASILAGAALGLRQIMFGFSRLE